MGKTGSVKRDTDGLLKGNKMDSIAGGDVSMGRGSNGG